MANLNLQNMHLTLRRIRFLTYVVMSFVAVVLAVSIVFGLFGLEFSFKNGAVQTFVVTDLRPLTDRVMVVVVQAIGPILFLFGAAQVVFFTECFGANFVRQLDASRFARNAGIVTIAYAAIEPLISIGGQLLNISLFIFRRVPWNSSAKMNVQYGYQGNIIALSLMMAFMFFLVSHMLKIDGNESEKNPLVAAE